MQVKQSLRNQKILFTTWVGLWLNVGLAIFKIAAGIFGNSRAVVADGIHSVSDLITDVAVILGVKYWSAPADEDHPYGHSRLEDIITIFIGVILALVGFGIIWDAIDCFRQDTKRGIGAIAVIAALVSVFVKELLYRWTILQGKRYNSNVLIANAWHHRSDALSSVPVTLAAGTAIFFPALEVVDFIGAIIVSLFILAASWQIAKPALEVLMDRGVCPEIRKKIFETVNNIPGVISSHALRTRFLGSSIQIDIHIMVDPAMSVQESHDLATQIERTLLNLQSNIIDIIIHVEPYSKGTESKEEDHHSI